MKKKVMFCIVLGIILIISGIVILFYKNSDLEKYKLEKIDILKHESYVYVPKHDKDEKLPLVMVFHGRGGSAKDTVEDCGWLKKAYEERFIVVSPQYDAYSNSYVVTDDLIEIVKYVIHQYDVDENRVFASGFSMGGAASVALTRDYPEYFAAIAPMGWMFDMPDKDDVYKKYDMPFLVIQGTKEYTYEDENGNIALNEEEQRAVRALLLYNELIDLNTHIDLDNYPYWGFKGDKKITIEANNQNWHITEFYKDDYESAFAKLIIRENGKHTKDSYSATLAWDFMSKFSRVNGEIVELKD